MSARAAGTFDVKTEAREQEPFEEGTTLGRFSLDKTYRGGLDATARGEMLTAGTPVEGSAAYVAIERVEGTLDGRQGTFVLQHAGRMGHGTMELTVLVVPDSGTGELTGLAGELDIVIADGEHSYTLDYTLPD